MPKKRPNQIPGSNPNQIKDFKKSKTKVGQNSVSANATSTSFKAKPIKMPSQHALSNKNNTKINDTLLSLISNFKHYNPKYRRDAYNTLKDIFNEEHNLIAEKLGFVAEKIVVGIIDDERAVRNAAFNLYNNIMQHASHNVMKPFLPHFMAFICSGLSSLNSLIRKDAILVLQLVLKYYPSYCWNSSTNLLAIFVNLIADRDIVNDCLYVQITCFNLYLKNCPLLQKDITIENSNTITFESFSKSNICSDHGSNFWSQNYLGEFKANFFKMSQTAKVEENLFISYYSLFNNILNTFSFDTTNPSLIKSCAEVINILKLLTILGLKEKKSATTQFFPLIIKFVQPHFPIEKDGEYIYLNLAYCELMSLYLDCNVVSQSADDKWQSSVFEYLVNILSVDTDNLTASTLTFGLDIILNILSHTDEQTRNNLLNSFNSYYQTISYKSKLKIICLNFISNLMKRDIVSSHSMGWIQALPEFLKENTFPDTVELVLLLLIKINHSIETPIIPHLEFYSLKHLVLLSPKLQNMALSVLQWMIFDKDNLKNFTELIRSNLRLTFRLLLITIISTNLKQNVSNYFSFLLSCLFSPDNAPLILDKSIIQAVVSNLKNLSLGNKLYKQLGPIVLKISNNLTPFGPTCNKLEVLLNLFHLFLEEDDAAFSTYPEELVFACNLYLLILETIAINLDFQRVEIVASLLLIWQHESPTILSNRILWLFSQKSEIAWNDLEINIKNICSKLYETNDLPVMIKANIKASLVELYR